MVMPMTRVGRKRRAVARKNGRIDWRAEQEEDPALATKWHRARDAFLNDLGGDRRLASQAGKLFVHRNLSAIELEACDRWSELLAGYDRIVLGMTRTAHPPALERLGVSLGSEMDLDRVAQFRDRFDAAQASVVNGAGKRCLTALNRLCRDEAASSVLVDARAALAQLVDHFRLAPKPGT